MITDVGPSVRLAVAGRDRAGGGWRDRSGRRSTPVPRARRSSGRRQSVFARAVPPRISSDTAATRSRAYDGPFELVADRRDGRRCGGDAQQIVDRRFVDDRLRDHRNVGGLDDLVFGSRSSVLSMAGVSWTPRPWSCTSTAWPWPSIERSWARTAARSVGDVVVAGSAIDHEERPPRRAIRPRRWRASRTAWAPSMRRRRRHGRHERSRRNDCSEGVACVQHHSTDRLTWVEP